MPKVRLAIPRELDSRPLVWSFLKGHHQGLFQPVEYSAERIVPLLLQGEVEVGLVPAASYLRDRQTEQEPLASGAVSRRELDVVGDICAAAHAQTLVLQSHVPFEDIKSVDTERVASWASDLAHLVVRDSLGRELRPAPWHESPDDPGADAVLMTSDALLSADAPDDLFVIDLVELWKRKTGFPLVLSLWAFAKSSTLPDLEFYLKSSLRYGLSSLETLSRELAAERGLEASRVSSYLGDHLSYVLGEPERLGLAKLQSCLEPVSSPMSHDESSKPVSHSRS